MLEIALRDDNKSKTSFLIEKNCAHIGVGKEISDPNLWVGYTFGVSGVGSNPSGNYADMRC